MATATYADGIEQSFDVDRGATVEVDAEGARVAVEGGADEVSIWITRGDDSRAEIEEDYDIDINASSSRVSLRVEKRRKLTSWLGGRGLQIRIDTPERVDLDLHTSGGQVRVEDIEGFVKAHTSGGSMHFDGINGGIDGETSGGSIQVEGPVANAELKTSGGAIRLDDVAGEVRAQTSGGRIELGHVGGDVVAQTSGGSIEIEAADGAVDAKTSGGGIRVAFTTQPTRSSELRTSGGTITVDLADGVGVDLDAKSSGGRLKASDDLDFRGDATKDSLQGQVNGGGPSLRVRASGGSIVLDRH